MKYLWENLTNEGKDLLCIWKTEKHHERNETQTKWKDIHCTSLEYLILLQYPYYPIVSPVSMQSLSTY